MKKFKRIYIEITNVCNFKCSFCIETNRKKRFMSKEEFSKIIDKVKNNVESVFLHIKGEPLLNKDLEYILEICEKNNLDVNITTNGYLLEENKEILVKSKSLRQLNVSLHSIEENKLNNISQKEYVDKVINACKYIDKNSKCIISYRLWNLDEIKKLDKDRYILEKLEKEYNFNADNIQKNYMKLTDKTYLNLDTIFKWPCLENGIISKCGSCYGLRTQIGILVDGSVVPCCLDNNGDITLGNIFEEDLETILNKKRAKDIYNGFMTGKLVEPLCQRCGFRENKRK